MAKKNDQTTFESALIDARKNESDYERQQRLNAESRESSRMRALIEDFRDWLPPQAKLGAMALEQWLQARNLKIVKR